MVVTARKRTPPPKGSAKPRLSPPVPARTDLDLFHETCRTLEIELIPSQEEVARYLYALGQGSSWLYREIAELMSRQNGKTEPLVPHIVTRLRMGRRIMHTAQDRTLPREVFERVVDAMVAHYSKELRGRPRLANGQESIRTNNGGRYRIVAPTRGGARGPEARRGARKGRPILPSAGRACCRSTRRSPQSSAKPAGRAPCSRRARSDNSTRRATRAGRDRPSSCRAFRPRTPATTRAGPG